MDKFLSRFWEVIGLSALVVLFCLEINGSVRAADLGGKPKSIKVGEQPSNPVDDGSDKDVVPKGRQPGSSLADQVDNEAFGGDRAIKLSQPEIRYKPTQIDGTTMYVVEYDSKGPYARAVSKLKKQHDVKTDKNGHLLLNQGQLDEVINHAE
ncbi:hypothetical protein GW916_09615 [bacterium]|nr:hypothetical protein [bacterium]